MTESVPVRSVKKALDILDLIVEADLCDVDASLDGLAHRMKMPVSSTHNLLKTMVACGYVCKNGHGLYALGVKCRQMGRLNRLSAPAAHATITGLLRQLAAAEGEACLLAVLVNGARVLVTRVDSTQAIQVSNATIEDRPFFSRATGRILASIASDEELRQIVARHGLPDGDWNGIADETALKRELAKVRRQGWSHVDTEDEGLVGLACPVTDTAGRAWGALGLYAPAFRCPAKRRKELIQALRQCAMQFADALPEGITPNGNGGAELHDVESEKRAHR